MRDSQPSHSRDVATEEGRRGSPSGFGHITQSLALGQGRHGWRSRSPRNHLAHGAQGWLHHPTRDVVGPDLDSGADAKGRQQSRREQTVKCGGKGHLDLRKRVGGEAG